MPSHGPKRPSLPTGRSVFDPHSTTGPQRFVGPQTVLSGAGQDFNGGHVGDLERIAHRRAQALAMRKLGLTYREIAAKTGVDPKTSYKDVQSELIALRETTLKDAREVKQMELERLDAYMVRANVQFQSGDTKAGFLLIKIGERRAKLLGLDAPVKLAATDPDGNAITIRRADLETMSDEELDAVNTALGKLRAPGDDEPTE
jgi:hypothetical protein